MKFPIYLQLLGKVNIDTLYGIYPYVNFCTNLIDNYLKGNLKLWIVPEDLINNRYTSYCSLRRPLENKFEIDNKEFNRLKYSVQGSKEYPQELNTLSQSVMEAYLYAMRSSEDPVCKHILELTELIFSLGVSLDNNHIKPLIKSAVSEAPKAFNNILGDFEITRFSISLVPNTKKGITLLEDSHEAFKNGVENSITYPKLKDSSSINKIIFGIYNLSKILENSIV